MAPIAQTLGRPTNPPRHTLSGHLSPGSATAGQQPTPADPGWPTGAQVWSWAGTAVLFGYGPSASTFA